MFFLVFLILSDLILTQRDQVSARVRPSLIMAHRAHLSTSLGLHARAPPRPARLGARRPRQRSRARTRRPTSSRWSSSNLLIAVGDLACHQQHKGFFDARNRTTFTPASCTRRWKSRRLRSKDNTDLAVKKTKVSPVSFPWTDSTHCMALRVDDSAARAAALDFDAKTSTTTCKVPQEPQCLILSGAM